MSELLVEDVVQRVQAVSSALAAKDVGITNLVYMITQEELDAFVAWHNDDKSPEDVKPIAQFQVNGIPLVVPNG